MSYATPTGDPRSSGVVYKAVGRHLYLSVAHESWKAKHLAQSRRVAMVVPLPRGALLSLFLSIPPATITLRRPLAPIRSPGETAGREPFCARMAGCKAGGRRPSALGCRV